MKKVGKDYPVLRLREVGGPIERDVREINFMRESKQVCPTIS